MKKVFEKLNNLRGSPKGRRQKILAAHLAPLAPTEFRLVQDSRQTQELFRRMKESIAAANEQTRFQRGASAKMRYEWGTLPEGREFFYLQPWNEEGLLFEQAHRGWIISKAHKVPQDRQFMRESRTWDVVTLFEPKDSGMLRISSSRFGDELMSFPLYQEALLESLPFQHEV
ncbi:hypothetical protein [Pseudobacteriovorax antillogorgiicola]|uniref:Uncharacterized protein n=1 Tax=Pseudobacteriovorax antillogorgiicola TaxID=1513793 RepID=A0A1Y6C2B6_9BACT|nr:hypothetical protein [Pseudobacteriovorax antillogorgiicola]TCS50644.1 hypothetical protein EDD56_11223 [Pseudobacteriovorax antillogorgiicola]SMF39632.1 hypothetical protein SAMN06296036_11222 [Pseudobacteriovorax antillogorgiicola]